MPESDRQISLALVEYVDGRMARHADEAQRRLVLSEFAIGSVASEVARGFSRAVFRVAPARM
jgi:hypothetical protein